MIEDKITDSISRLFDMPCIEYAGQTRKGGVIYLVYDDLKVIQSDQKQNIDALCSISIVGVQGRVGIGFLSGGLMEFDSKSEDVKIEAIDQNEVRDWISSDVFMLSKQIRVTTTQDFDIVREQIKGINFKEG